MLKNCSILSALGAFLFLSILSPAQTTPDTPSAGTLLGSLEAAINFCAKANPQAASTYKLLDQLITNGQTTKAISQARDTDAYRTAYKHVSSQLQSLPASRIQTVCAAH